MNRSATLARGLPGGVTMVAKPRRYSRPSRIDGGRDWYLVSSHGSILFHIAANPDATVQDLAEDLSLTYGTVSGLIGDLRRADMLYVRKSGHRHYYWVDLEAPFHHPTIRGYRLRDVVGKLVKRGRRDRRR